MGRIEIEIVAHTDVADDLCDNDIERAICAALATISVSLSTIDVEWDE